MSAASRQIASSSWPSMVGACGARTAVSVGRPPSAPPCAAAPRPAPCGPCVPCEPCRVSPDAPASFWANADAGASQLQTAMSAAFAARLVTAPDEIQSATSGTRTHPPLDSRPGTLLLFLRTTPSSGSAFTSVTGAAPYLREARSRLQCLYEAHHGSVDRSRHGAGRCGVFLGSRATAGESHGSRRRLCRGAGKARRKPVHRKLCRLPRCDARSAVSVRRSRAWNSSQDGKTKPSASCSRPSRIRCR